MELELKRDFEQARQKWQAFWNGQHSDRPILQLVAMKDGAAGTPRVYPVRPDLDVESQIEQALARASEREYLAEAVPNFMMEFAAEHFAALLGAELEFRSGTGWVKPCLKDWDGAPIVFKPDSYYWQKTIEFLRAFRRRCDGKLLVNAPVLSGGLDVLAAMRGTERLLTDLLDCPEQVQRALARVRRAYDEVVQELARELNWEEFGSCNWMGMYHPGRINMIQCDFSCMINREMFAGFQVPCLKHEAAHYDAVSYHLDGPQAEHHLESICALEEIDVLQYVPVPKESPEHIESIYRRAGQLGKGIIRPADCKNVRRLWDEATTRRVIFVCHTQSRKQAEEILAEFD